jgi:putative heme transporter
MARRSVRPQTRGVATIRSGYAAVETRIPARALRTVLAVAVIALLVCAALRSRSLVPSLGRLGHPDAGWLFVAVLAQAASLVAYALVVRELLRAGAVAARVSTLLRATLGGIAMGASLPGGQVASAAYWYKQLRREGAARSLTALAMVGSMVAGVLSLALLFVVGVAAAGGEGPLAAARMPILEGGAVVVALVVVCRRGTARAGARLVRRLAPGLPDGYSPGQRSLFAMGFLAVANWLFDCACLCAALAAVHASVPVRSVLLAYTLSQLVASLPLLPGGGGTVEATLLLTFAAFQHTSASVFAGVLLFRLISCWGLIPVGWLAVVIERRPVLLRRAPLLRQPAATAAV